MDYPRQRRLPKMDFFRRFHPRRFSLYRHIFPFLFLIWLKYNVSKFLISLVCTLVTVFVYNTQFHNVKQVSRRDFISCNATSALATYNSGSDTVALKKPGHYYFLCGFPGHCQAGQKLHVLVVATSTASPSLSLSPDLSPVPSPSTGSSPSPSPATASEDSAQNGAISFSLSLSTAMSGVVVFWVALMLY